MTGLEQMAIAMLQKMTGLTPEQMQELANKAVNLLQSVDSRMLEMENSLNRIEDYLMPKLDGNGIPQLEGKANVKDN